MRNSVRPANDRSAEVAKLLLSPQMLPQVLRTIQRWIEDREDANDVLAVLVEKVARTYSGDPANREEVFKVAREAARTISIDEIRRRAAQKRGGGVVGVSLAEDFVGVYLQRHATLEAEWIESVISRLPEDLIEVTRLYVFQGEELTSAIRFVFDPIDEPRLSVIRARWYHHVRLLQPLVDRK